MNISYNKKGSIKMKKMFALMLVIVLALSCFTACGGSSDSDLKYIQDKGTLVIGMTIYPPMNYYDDSGKLVGFDTELAEAVCAKLNLTAHFQEIEWNS